MAITFGDKFLISFVFSISVACLFSIYQLYFSSYFQIPEELLIIIELLSLSFIHFFILLNIEDGVIGFFSGLTYSLTKDLIISFIKMEEICLLNALIFSLAFFIISLAIAFQREQSLKNVRFSLLGATLILLSFSIASFLLIVYSRSFQPLLCFYPQKILISLFRSFP